MATQIAYATGNLSGASTWKTAEVGAGALTLVRNNTTTLASNTTITSPAFTITNGKVIEGVLLWVMANQATPAGTLTINLLKSAVSQASVTVNLADLPHSAVGTNDVLAVVPVFFRFTSTATGDGTANWTLNMVTSNVTGAQLTYSRNSATAGDFTKALRTSTTASIAAADDLYITGELTGAGTHTSFTVTMDSTATTAYGNGSINSTTVSGGGVRISAYGTLNYGTSASTNYVLRVNGDVEVFWNGTFQMGVTGTEIPRTSTAVLELAMNSATNDYGITAHNLSTFTSAGLSRTSGKNIVKCKLNANLAATGTTLNVDTDTGWLSGDVVCVASTTRTAGDSETLTLSGNATATSMPVGAAANAHSGTSPTQGEVGLLTRNVKIRSTSSSLLTNFYPEPLATVSCTWTEFNYLGANTTNKWGISITNAAVVNPKTFSYCSMHDSYAGIWAQSSGSGPPSYYGLTATYNVMWNMAAYGVVVQSTKYETDWTLDNNLVIKTAQQGFYLWLWSGTITNNTIVSATSYAYYYANSNNVTSGFSPDPTGNFSSNTAHSNASWGIYCNFGFPQPTVPWTGNSVWRNGAGIVNVGQPWMYVRWDSLTVFGNSGTNVQIQYADALNITGNSIIAGDATFSTARGIYFVFFGYAPFLLNLNGVDFSGTGTGLAAHTSYDIDYTYNAYTKPVQGFAVGCKWGTSPPYVKTYFQNYSYIAHERYNGTAGDHRYDGYLGLVQTDTTIFNNASPSLRMTPNTLGATSQKLTSNGEITWPGSQNSSPGILAACNNGGSVNISCYVRKAAASDAPTVWNANDRSNSNFLLSNGNLTLTSNQGAAGGARGSSAPRSNAVSSGKLYVEYTGASLVSTSGFGIATGAASLSGFSTNGTGGFVVYQGGEIWLNGTDTGINIGALGTSVIGMAIDFTNLRGWFRVGTGNWNNSGTANPATNVGGVDLSGFFTSTTGAYPVAFFASNGPAVTANFGATAFTNTAPSGFTSWDSGQPFYMGSAPRLIQKANPALGQYNDVVLATLSAATGTWAQLSATSSVATDDGVWEFAVDCDGNGQNPNALGWVNVDDWTTT